MKIAFVSTCKDREAHLAQTLPRNLADNPRSTFIVLDYGSAEPLTRARLGLDSHPELGSESHRLFLYRYEARGPFHMAHAKNLAGRLGIHHGADWVCNVDADNFLHWGFEDFIAQNAQPGVFFKPPIVAGWGKRFRGVGGRIAVPTDVFLKTGGYAERFDHWDHDDKEFDARVRYLGYREILMDRCYLEAIPHGDGVRFKDYPHVREMGLGEDTPLPPVKTAVVNFGKVGVGEVVASNGKRVQIDPIPTRIFGIGLHKTATTSLHKALQILGYDSIHWSSGTGTWARDVWDEMLRFGKSKTVEQSYALSDLPIGLLYRELDRAYAGSKFILTTRDENDWLRSVQDHFSDKNPTRWEWDVWPISNRIHHALYGRKTFDADIFLQRFRRHNAEVREYFKNRSDDLLVMEKPSWRSLCWFLKRSVPQMPYPREYVTGGQKKPPAWAI